MRCLLYPLIAVFCLLAAACASQPENHVDSNTRIFPDALDAEVETGQSQNGHYPVRPFPIQTLYSLLAAEIAGTRGQFDYSLQNYLHEARQTRDIGVVARAARIAHYVDNPPALAEMSTLWIELEPSSIEARELAVFALLKLNQADRAFAHAQFLLNQGKGSAIRKLPNSAARLPEPARLNLLTAYRNLIPSHPDNPDVLFAYTLLLWQLSEFTEALKQAEKLASLEPDDETALLLLAQLLHLNSHSERALDQLEIALEKHPDSGRITPHYLRILFTEPEFKTSTERLNRVSQRFPGNEDLQFGLALLHRETGNFGAANQVLLPLTRNPSRKDEAFHHLGLVAEKFGQDKQAEHYYRQVTESPHLLAATSRLIRILVKREQLEDARQYLLKLRSEQTDLIPNLYQMEAELLFQEHLYQTAHAVLSEALHKYPRHIDLLYTRSLVSEKLLDIAAVEADLRLILAQDANHQAALNALGYSLTNHTTRYEEAQSLIEKALSFSPDDPATIDSLGWVLYRRGLHSEALTHLRQAASLLPDAEIAAHLGEVLWVKGEQDEARAIFSEALKKAPNHSVLLETIERLEVDLN